jgi:uncharacterized CHY-type Zn-finger protein
MGKHSKVLRVCAAPNCGPSILVGRGLCRKHYERFRNHGDLTDYEKRFIAAVFSSEKLKPCGTCKLELHIDQFSINGSKSDPTRRKSICRECSSKRAKKSRQLRISAGVCLYCDRPARDGAVKCAFHLKERIRYRATLPARISAMLAGAKKRASRDKVLFTLTEDWVKSRLHGKCELTSIPFDLEIGGRRGKFNPYSPSIDRKIPGADYTPQNCRMILTALNIGINYWGEEIYRNIAKSYLRQRRVKSVESKKNETMNLLLDVQYPQLTDGRKH